MAHSGSAQREPSMEEILASIRRIIQDSDSVQQPVEGAPAFDVPPAAPDAAGDAAGEVEAFRAGLDEARPAPDDDAPDAAAVETPASRPAVDITSPKAQVHPLRAPVRPARTAFPASDDDGLVGKASVSSEPTPVDAPTQPSGESAPSAPEADAAAPSQAPSSGDQAVAELRPSIISDHAGRQVAASFGELSEAFAASRRRSFDDLAQEMLRPMLQEWLDNNLPTLVERLVREEIERVARGG